MLSSLVQLDVRCQTSSELLSTELLLSCDVVLSVSTISDLACDV